MAGSWESPVESSLESNALERIGRRVRELRQHQAMSMSTLSARSNLGRGTLVELERAGRTPNLDTLMRVASALDVTLGALVEDQSPPALTPAGVVDPETGDAMPLARWSLPNAQAEVFRLRLEPRAQRVRPYPRGSRGYLTVLTGTVRAGSAATPRTASAGGQIAFAADQPHVYEAVGGPAECVLVVRYDLAQEAPAAGPLGPDATGGPGEPAGHLEAVVLAQPVEPPAPVEPAAGDEPGRGVDVPPGWHLAAEPADPDDDLGLSHIA